MFTTNFYGTDVRLHLCNHELRQPHGYRALNWIQDPPMTNYPIYLVCAFSVYIIALSITLTKYTHIIFVPSMIITKSKMTFHHQSDTFWPLSLAGLTLKYQICVFYVNNKIKDDFSLPIWYILTIVFGWLDSEVNTFRNHSKSPHNHLYWSHFQCPYLLRALLQAAMGVKNCHIFTLMDSKALGLISSPRSSAKAQLSAMML